MKDIILEKIMKSSYELLINKGIRDISVQDIVKHANISTRTFYRYLSSKEEVINRIIKTGLERNKSVLKMLNTEVKNPIDAYVIFISTTFMGVKNMSTKFYIDLVKYYPAQFNLINNFIFKDIQGFYIEMINESKKLGLFRKEINSKFSAMYIVETNFNSLFKLFLNGKDFNKEFVFLELHRTLAYGMCTKKGLERFKIAARNYFPALIDMSMRVYKAKDK